MDTLFTRLALQAQDLMVSIRPMELHPQVPTSDSSISPDDLIQDELILALPDRDPKALSSLPRKNSSLIPNPVSNQVISPEVHNLKSIELLQIPKDKEPNGYNKVSHQQERKDASNQEKILIEPAISTWVPLALPFPESRPGTAKSHSLANDSNAVTRVASHKICSTPVTEIKPATKKQEPINDPKITQDKAIRIQVASDVTTWAMQPAADIALQKPAPPSPKIDTKVSNTVHIQIGRVCVRLKPRQVNSVPKPPLISTIKNQVSLIDYLKQYGGDDL
jgi:hypothetical protein